MDGEDGGSKEGEILMCQTVQLLSRNVLHNRDMISKPTSARKCMTVYGTHTVYRPHVSATYTAIFREVHYTG